VWGVLRGKPAAATAVEGRTQFWQWNRYTPLARNNAAMREGDWKLVYPLLPETNKLLPHEAARRRKLDRGELTFDEIQAIVTPEPDYSGLASPPAQLFNLADDPSESQDRVTEEPERAARMVAALDTWFEAIEAERTSRAAGF
jgi:hypothetical protein